MVRFPPELVERLLAQATQEFTVHGRRPGWSFAVNAGEFTLLADGGATAVFDARTGERRPTTHDDWLRRHAAPRRARRRRLLLVPHRLRRRLRAAGRLRALLRRRLRHLRQARAGLVRHARAGAVAQGGPRHRVRRPRGRARADAAVVPHHAGLAAHHRARLHADLARAARLRAAGGDHADAAAGRHGARQPARHAARRQLRDDRHAVPRAGGGAGHAGDLLAGGRHAWTRAPGCTPPARSSTPCSASPAPRWPATTACRPSPRASAPRPTSPTCRPPGRRPNGGAARDALRPRRPGRSRVCSAAPPSSASSRSSWTSR